MEKYDPIAKVPKVYTYIGEQASDLGDASNFIQRANGKAFPNGTRITWKPGSEINTAETGSKQAVAHIEYPNGGSEDVTVDYEVLATIKPKGPVMIFKEQLLIREQFGIIMLIKRERLDIQVVQAKLGVKMVK